MSETVFEAELSVAMHLAHNVALATNQIEVSVPDAAGYVLAADIVAKSDLPPFAASRVDGYAVNGLPPWQKIGSNLAGSTIDVSLASGQAMYVATGAAIPNGTTAMIKQEDCDVHGDLIKTLNSIEDSQILTLANVRPVGYEAKTGEVLVTKGTKLTPALLGLIAASGYDNILVQQKPRVDVLIFGDELITSGPSGSGKVRDSIGPQFKAWLNFFGSELNQIRYVADNLEDHVDAISESTADLVITTGGTASGPADHLHQAITKCGGKLLIDAVLVRPGYHQLIAKLPEKVLIGLPGNPQSAVVGIYTLVMPYLLGATGQMFPEISSKVLAQDVHAPKNENRLALCRIDKENQNVLPVEHVDSSMLRGFASANGFAIIKLGGQKAGERVDWLALP